MSKSDEYRANADQCGELAERAPSEPARRRYRRMEAGWRSLAQDQDWLEGRISPVAESSATTASATVGLPIACELPLNG